MAKNIFQGMKGLVILWHTLDSWEWGKKYIWRHKIRAPDLPASAGCCTAEVLVHSHVAAALPPETAFWTHRRGEQPTG